MYKDDRTRKKYQVLSQIRELYATLNLVTKSFTFDSPSQQLFKTGKLHCDSW